MLNNNRNQMITQDNISLVYISKQHPVNKIPFFGNRNVNCHCVEWDVNYSVVPTYSAGLTAV